MNNYNGQYQIKLNGKIKKAVMAGEGYEDLETLLEFIEVSVNETKFRIERIERRLEKLYGRVKIEHEGSSVVIKCTSASPGEEETDDNTAILIQHINDKGKIEFFTRNMCSRDDLVANISELMWAVAVLPLYYAHLKGQISRLKDVKNSAAIKAMSTLSKQINADLFTKVAAVSGFNVLDGEDTTDPYGIFGEEE